MTFWTESPRRERLIFETIPNTCASVRNAKANGILAEDEVDGFSLTWNYNSDEKVTGTLDVSGVSPLKLKNNMVRIKYRATAGGETHTVLLATCYMVAARGHYEDGRYSGTVELVSPLARYTEDALHRHYAIPKGAKCKDVWDDIRETYGGWTVWDGASNFTFSKNKVVEFGSSVWKLLQELSGSSVNQIGLDEWGRTTIRKYVRPKNRDVSYTLPAGAESMTLPGIDIDESFMNEPNRVACYYAYRNNSGEDKELFGLATSDSSHSYARQSTGRWKTEAVRLSDLSPKTKARITEVAKKRLANKEGVTTHYTFSHLYLPFKEGQVIRFRYDGFSFNALVQEMDMRARAGEPLVCTTKVRRLW